MIVYIVIVLPAFFIYRTNITLILISINTQVLFHCSVSKKKKKKRKVKKA